jgi:RNA polymerase sigma factor (sigma-70 family)
MANDAPVSRWLAGVKQGDPLAAEQLWQAYWRRVAGMARKILARGRGGNSEDVAQSAFRSFFVRARDGRFPRLEDRHDLWNLLAVITVRKAIKHNRRQSQQPSATAEIELVESQLAREPSPEHVVAMRDEIQRLMGLLDDTSRVILRSLLAGRTNQEAADECQVSLATIERKRKLIRETWRRELER